MALKDLKAELEALANPAQAKVLSGFFKTGKGQYGEGDIFLGIKVPVQRSVAKKHKSLQFNDIQALLNSKIHEYRLVALIILVHKFEEGNAEEKKRVFDFYLKNTKNINNWDLVDVTCDKIVGAYLLNRDRSILYRLAKSTHLWERRISIISTFQFIKNGEYKDTLAIAEILLKDKHDLMHKAVGWMLREVGKRVSQDAEEEFLKKHCKTMPRTMLRYAIERFDEKKKSFYMGK